MTASTNGNQNAFPASEQTTVGLTKREYMAAHILASMVAGGRIASDHSRDARYASHAVELADALLDALDAKPQK